ncbi:UPF0481 protein At3g47200-like [Zingiber officinale]|uniref:UPF0481 protein At3g47200-like n=1 Tax=Zingiber officinale TaxID=94328 RepID=UPI001C4DB8BE|nr:UPF0481 protein At3g47200-like [Zingiber officinale]
MKNKDSTSAINIDAKWERKLENNAIYQAPRRVKHQNPTIFKVLNVFRDVEPGAYDPMIVSLGPYHHHQPRLQATNQLKRLLLNKLLEKGHEKSLRNYLILIKENETKVRRTYSEAPIDMCEEQFVEMMLLDSVFVIMILWFWKNEGLEAIEDPIFRSGQRILILLARDMLLVENQLPFFLLEALFDKAFPDKCGKLKSWISQFFSRFMGNEHTLLNLYNVTIHHILHLLYSCNIVPLITSIDVVAPTVLEDLRLGRVPSVTQLEVTRIKIKRKQKATTFLDITFKKGVLEIPQIEIDDDTNVLFRNLIAFEQCQNNPICNAISTYVWFLSCIAETVADVELLQRKAIIINRLGSKKEVVKLFRKLCKEVVVDIQNCYISSVFKEIARYQQMKYVVCRCASQMRCFSKSLVMSLVCSLSLQ